MALTSLLRDLKIEIWYAGIVLGKSPTHFNCVKYGAAKEGVDDQDEDGQQIMNSWLFIETL
jgi:hypothetical protein